MPPKNRAPLKSYSRADTSSNRSKLDILHNILKTGIQKKKSRKKLKIEIKELPPPPPNTCFANNSSLKLNYDNTFDRLLNEPDYNKVAYKAMATKSSWSCSNSSENCSSIQIKRIIYSPMRTRGIRRRQISPLTIPSEVAVRSPVITRSVAKKVCKFSDSMNGRKEKTLEKSIYDSLYIEKIKTDNQKPIALSFSISSIEKSASLLKVRDCINNNSSINSTCGQIFTDTFKEKYNNFNNLCLPQTSAISSTPVQPVFHKKILSDTISPIANVKSANFHENGTPKLKRASRVRKSILLENKTVNSCAIENSEECDGNGITNLKSVDENTCKVMCTVHESDCKRSMSLFETSTVNTKNVQSDLKEQNCNYPRTCLDLTCQNSECKSTVNNVNKISVLKDMNEIGYQNVSAMHENECNGSESLFQNSISCTNENAQSSLKEGNCRRSKSLLDVTQEDSEFNNVEGNVQLDLERIPFVNVTNLDLKNILEGSSYEENSEFLQESSISTLGNFKQNDEVASTRKVNDEVPFVVSNSQLIGKREKLSIAPFEQNSELVQEENISTAHESKLDELQTEKDNYITVGRPKIRELELNPDENVEVSSISKASEINSKSVYTIYESEGSGSVSLFQNSVSSTVESIQTSLKEESCSKSGTLLDLTEENSESNDTESDVVQLDLKRIPFVNITNLDLNIVSDVSSCEQSSEKNKSDEGQTKKSTYVTIDRPRTRRMNVPPDRKTNDEILFAVPKLPRSKNQGKSSITPYEQSSELVQKNSILTTDQKKSNGRRTKKNEYNTIDRPITRQFLKSKQNVNVFTTKEANDEVPFAVPKLPPSRKKEKSNKGEELVLKPGKLWRRSLLEVRNSKVGVQSMRRSTICVADKGNGLCTCTKCKAKLIENSTPRRLSVRVVPLSSLHVSNNKRYSVLENYAVACHQSYISDALQESLLEECFENLSLNKKNSGLCLEDEPNYQHRQEVTVTARDVVLRKCGQVEPLSFEKCYPNSILQHCQKIGEGVYGEVFLFRRTTGGTSVMKVIPIEGDLIVNGEHQKKFEEILSEITIAMELSNLRENQRNSTSCFSELHKVTCVKGKYPARLQELWELFDEARGSENDHPDIFDDDQLYIVLELTNGGKDMESFVFNSAQQAYAVVTQIACALAVAEVSLEFEHRDLHWGNILLSNVDNDAIKSFRLDGKDISLKTYGAEVTIIDFTLSRISLDGVCIYNDLSLDPDLFTATGDYQFELYRLMQKQNGNEWQHFEPYTNILWLDYVLEKALKAVRYQRKTTKLHKKYLGYLRALKNGVLQYKSAEEFVSAKLIDDISIL